MLNAMHLAVRQLRHHPTFAIVTVLVLGLGTAAATTVFTVVDSVVLRPLPYPRADRLVTIWDTNYERGLAHDPISPVNFMDVRALPVFIDAAAWWRPSVNLLDPGLEPVRVNTIEVSGNLFEVLGVGPQVGAGFPKDRFFASNDRVAVISDRLWRMRYHADPSIVGRPLEFNGTPYTIAGVMPPRFHFPDDVDVWQRLQWDLTQHSRAAHFMEAVARLSDETTFAEAQAASDALAHRLQASYPQTNNAWGTRLVPLLDEQLGYYRPALMVLFGAVGLLLVIGCLNVASLLLTRAISRRRDIAIRMAMGASPRHLMMELLAEGVVLATAGAVVGVVAAAIALPAIVHLTPVTIPRLDEASIDLRALGLGVAIATGTTIFFGLVPALVVLRGRFADELRSGERGSSHGARRIYSVLVVGEVALACALLVSSALLVRTVTRMTNTPTGISADDAVITSVQLSRTSYADWQRVADVHAGILDEIRQQPGVRAAGGSNFLPFEVGWRVPFTIDGEPPPGRSEDAPQAQYHSVSDGYFESLGARIIAGRAFSRSDTARTAPVAIVNDTFARRFLSDRPAVGRVVLTSAGGIGPLGLNLVRTRQIPSPGSPEARHAPPTGFEIVGVMADIRNAPLGQIVEPAIYFSAQQFPFREQFIAVRAENRAAATAALRAALKAIAPDVPLNTVSTWAERYALRTAEPRMLMTILLVFGGLAGLLAGLGVYGLFSWSVALRTRELAIRLTLGARPSTVGRLVVQQSALLAVVGVVAGLGIIRLVERALAHVLFEVSPGDSGAAVAAATLLLAAAFVASLPPALRAARVDPVEGLRVE